MTITTQASLSAEGNQDRELLMDSLPWPADSPTSDRRRARDTSEQFFIEGVLTTVLLGEIEAPETSEAEAYLYGLAADSLLVRGYLFCVHLDAGFTVDESLNRLTATLRDVDLLPPLVASWASLAVAQASASSLCLEYAEDWSEWLDSFFADL